MMTKGLLKRVGRAVPWGAIVWILFGWVLHSLWGTTFSTNISGAPGIDPWQTEQTLARRTVFSNPWMSLERHSVNIEGQVITDWMWVNVPDMVNILVHEDASDKWLLFQMRKYGLNTTSYAPVGGYVEKGESPQDAAHREVFEELGLTVGTLAPLGSFRTDANRGFGVYHAFVALNAHSVGGHQRTGDLESVSLMRCSLADLGKYLSTNAFKEVKWSNTVSLAVRWLETSQDPAAVEFRRASASQ